MALCLMSSSDHDWKWRELKVGGGQMLEVVQVPGNGGGRYVDQSFDGAALFSPPITRDRKRTFRALREAGARKLFSE